MSAHTIDTAMARRMLEASAIRGASIIGLPGDWSVMLKFGMTEKPLGAQRTDKPRTWRSLDTCMNYLKNELHIVRVDMPYQVSVDFAARRAALKQAASN